MKIFSVVLINFFLYSSNVGCCYYTSVPDQGISANCSFYTPKDIERLSKLNYSSPDPEVTMSIVEIIRNRGYTAIEYDVTTADGYILNLVRIPGSKGSTTTEGKISVMYVHGFMQDGSAAVVNPDETALGFWFADHGYDVYLANTRGTIPSRMHETLSTASPGPYWNFTFHEKGMYDIPAFINKVLELNGAAKLYYIGHSQGTTEFFVAASRMPEINEKVPVMFALGPAAYLSKANVVLKIIANALHVTQYIPDYGNKLLPLSPEISGLGANILCSGLSVKYSVCSNILFLITGFDAKNAEESKFTSLLGHSGQGESLKDLMHLAQLSATNKFAEFDYGLGNMGIYGSLTPPKYDLSQITSKVFLFCGTCDQATTPGDCKAAAKEIPDSTIISIEEYNHIDYLFAKNADVNVYQRIHQEIQKSS